VRTLKLREQKKRGCCYCTEVTKIVDAQKKSHTSCPHEKCPFTVLDKYNSYDEFLASEDSKILVEAFFEPALGKYRLENFSNTPGKLFIDRMWHL